MFEYYTLYNIIYIVKYTDMYTEIEMKKFLKKRKGGTKRIKDTGYCILYTITCGC